MEKEPSNSSVQLSALPPPDLIFSSLNLRASSPLQAFWTFRFLWKMNWSSTGVSWEWLGTIPKPGEKLELNALKLDPGELQIKTEQKHSEIITEGYKIPINPALPTRALPQKQTGLCGLLSRFLSSPRNERLKESGLSLLQDFDDETLSPLTKFMFALLNESKQSRSAN